MDEEVVLLEEQLAAANADIERLQGRIGELESAVAGREADATALRTQLTASQQTLTQRDTDIETLRQALDASSREATAAASRYRELLMLAEPELPADLVRGETVSEIDESAVRARQTVAQVRQHLEQQAQALRVPAGAPPRSAPDTSSMSPAEKIRLGLREA